MHFLDIWVCQHTIVNNFLEHCTECASEQDILFIIDIPYGVSNLIGKEKKDVRSSDLFLVFNM
jgi:hypothetical protein